VLRCGDAQLATTQRDGSTGFHDAIDEEDVSMQRIFLVLSTSPLLLALVSCGGGTYLTKPGTTLKNYADDKAACEATAPQMPMPTSEIAGDRKMLLGFRFMDPRVYECMLGRGWRHV
jgi:hypothetical protein